MEKNRVRVRIVLIFLIIIVIVMGLVLVANKSIPDEMSGATDLAVLKDSEYTNENFDKVELGTSVQEVEDIMGELKEEQHGSKFDVYSVEENDTMYYFYFNKNSLENVSVFLQS